MKNAPSSGVPFATVPAVVAAAVHGIYMRTLNILVLVVIAD